MSATILTGLLAFASLGFAPSAQEQVIDQFHPSLDVPAMRISSDPCQWLACDTPEQAVRTWTAEVFQNKDQDSAVAVAWRESHWKPYVCYDWHNKEEWQCQPPNAEKGKYGRATGLFQHRWKLWSYREQKARTWLAETHQIIIEEPLDIWDGWHSTIVAAWLVYDTSSGWKHFHSCASGARHSLKYEGVGGGGWVKTC